MGASIRNEERALDSNVFENGSSITWQNRVFSEHSGDLHALSRNQKSCDEDIWQIRIEKVGRRVIVSIALNKLNNNLSVLSSLLGSHER